MSTRERILTIRLLEKARLHPEFAVKLGICPVETTTNDIAKGKE